MRIVSKNARKSRIPRGKISVIELIEKVKKEESNKCEKLEKIINITFERVFNVPKNDYEGKIKILRKLGGIS